MGKFRVLIVDDHPMMRRGVRDALASDPEIEICGEAEDVVEALTQVRQKQPDLIILDVSLPSGSGLEVMKDIHTQDHRTRVLFLSMHDEAVFAERALQAGALGYINKARTGDELIEAVHKVMRGEIALSTEIADRLMRRALDNGAAGKPTGVSGLSDRELEIFDLIGRGLGTREIAERLCLSVKTVETHRQHIKQKLELSSAAELSRHAALWTQGGTQPSGTCWKAHAPTADRMWGSRPS